MGGTFLVIEDNPDNLELISKLLMAYGHDVQTAEDGEIGLQRALSSRFDLIVCDLEMPRMRGEEVVRELHIRQKESRPPIIAITAFAMVGDREKVLELGFDGYLSKPISVETFVQEVEAFLPPEKRSSGAPESCATTPAPEVVRKPVQANVLVVDDSSVNLDVIRGTLRSSGYEVLTAGSVEKGLEIARQNKLDLIISDVHMAPQDGYDFLRMVRADSDLSKLPFVFLTSSALSSSERARSLQLGAARFILRPIEPHVLLSEIESCLQLAKEA